MEYITKEQKRIEVLRRKAVKAFNTLLKDKNISSIVEYDGGYCITYKNGQQFFCNGYVPDNSNIYITE